MFQVDRALQLIVHFRMERMIHHGLTATWTLLMMEWTTTNSALRDPSIFVTGAIMEGLAKLSWFFHFIARMNRAFIRNQPNGEWDSKVIAGVDHLFICKTARKQTQLMRFGYGVFLLAHFVVPFAMVGVYLGVMRESVTLAWNFALPLIFVLFNVLDANQYKALSKQAKYTYWTETVFKKKRKKSPTQADAMTVTMHSLVTDDKTPQVSARLRCP